MNSETHTESARGGEPEIGLSTGGLFLELPACRDFPGMARCLAPEVRLRALLPPRDVDVTGPDAVVAEFRGWFGNDAETLEMVDATVGEVGPRLYLRWRIRMSSDHGGGESRIVEQHAYATAGEQIETLNLLCSGFVVDKTGPTDE